MTHLSFSKRIQSWSTPEEIDAHLASLDRLEEQYAGDTDALRDIAMERRRVEEAVKFAERVTEDDRGRLSLGQLTDET